MHVAHDDAFLSSARSGRAFAIARTARAVSRPRRASIFMSIFAART